MTRPHFGGWGAGAAACPAEADREAVCSGSAACRAASPPDVAEAGGCEHEYVSKATRIAIGAVCCLRISMPTHISGSLQYGISYTRIRKRGLAKQQSTRRNCAGTLLAQWSQASPEDLV